MLTVDWVLGVLYVHDLAPGWLFLLTNVPFGFVHSIVEKAWTGGQYILLGLTVPTQYINLIYLVMITAQSTLYFKLFQWIRSRA